LPYICRIIQIPIIMIRDFKDLTEEEVSTMMDAIPLVTVLISGADGDFSKSEREWAKKLVDIRSYNFPETMRPYFQKVGETFGDKMDALIKELPEDTSKRNQLVSERLANLNAIFPKLENNFAHRFYKNLLSFAEHVAKADGGFMRFATISKDEKKWLDLNMINPVELEEED